MTEIAPIEGVIELRDEFTSKLGLAQAVLSNFTKENQESLKAIAGAAGLVTAAFGAVMAATIALGDRGSDINDLDDTIVHFTGSAEAAGAVMQKLREGTKNTIDDFVLAKDAAHLLSAGVHLTADQFGTLGQAAFVLQNRGLGGTKEMLDLVSDAMVTGRTRALAMSLGVVDAGDAEQALADKLGVTKDMLSETAKAEAKRTAVMELLSKAVKDAGNQELDFGEKLEVARTTLTNWVDNVASAVAKSKVLAAGMDEIGKAVSEAFGGDNQNSIKTTVSFIENAAIIVVDFGLGAVEMARVVNVAWSAVKAAVLGTEAVVVGLVDVVTEAVAAVAIVGEKLHIVPEGAAEQIVEVRTQLRAMTSDLVDQANEAQKGIIGHSEFDKTLDKLGGTLYTVRDAMVKASKATEDNNVLTDAATNNAKKLAAAQAEYDKRAQQSMIDRAALAKLEKKSLEEIAQLTAEFNAKRIANMGTTEDAARAQIEATFQKAVSTLNKLDPAYDAHYKALRRVADESLNGIGSDWDSVKDKSIEALQQQADRAKKTYDEMVYGALHFTREALEEQRKKVEETALAVRGMGKDFVDAEKAAADAAKKASEAIAKQTEETKKAQEANRQMGGSTQIDASNLVQNAAYWKIPENVAIAAAKRGFSFEEILKAWQAGMISTWVPHGPRIPGFKEGGLVDIRVGEQGPETVRVPLGSSVFPNGMQAGTGGTTNHYWNVNGSAVEVAQKIKQVLMRELKNGRQFGSA